MTVEKGVLARISPETIIRGLRTDEEIRAFADSLSRRFARFAFPDDFVEAVSSMRKRIVDKHRKDTDEGNAYRALREIRVSASPSWEAPAPNIEFLFILEGSGPISQPLEEALTSLIGRFKTEGAFCDPAFRIVSLEDMTAASYLASDRLDLDHLSRGK